MVQAGNNKEEGTSGCCGYPAVTRLLSHANANALESCGHLHPSRKATRFFLFFFLLLQKSSGGLNDVVREAGRIYRDVSDSIKGG